MSLKYIHQIDQYLSLAGLISQKELDIIDSLEKYNVRPNYSFYQYLEIFPQAKQVIKNVILDQNKQYKEDIVQAEEVRTDFNTQILSRIDPKDKWFYTMVRDILFVKPLVNGRENKIKSNLFKLSFLNSDNKNLKTLTDQDIEQAKAVPLESLYAGRLYKRGSTLVGLCPFSTERNPSFTIYTKTNKFYCFSCNTGTDSINFIQKLNNCDFITAVKKLLNR